MTLFLDVDGPLYYDIIKLRNETKSYPREPLRDLLSH